MTKLLRISNELSLPIEAVTQIFAFLGRRGSGKSYAATKLAEEMLGERAQIVALDPVGCWYGLRIAADGKSKGFSIPVFGGLHGDVPLNANAGVLVADLIIEREMSAILDVSQMIKSEQTRFALDFATRFFEHRKRKPSAIHLFIEESQEFIAQNPMREESRTLHAFERLIKLGRNFGIGVSLISQRPQEVNKKALNQTECMFAFQMTGPQERKAIQSWVADKGVGEDIGALLPGLEVGCPRIWSPQWLRVSDTVRISQKITYDASSTPKVGVKAVEPRELSPVDVDQIKTAMADVIEQAEKDDPRKLRKRISELERQLSSRQVEEKTIEVLVLPDATIKQIDEVLGKYSMFISGVVEDFEKASAPVREMLTTLSMQLSQARSALPPQRAIPKHLAQPQRIGPPKQEATIRRTSTEALAAVTRPQQRILDALASFALLGISTVSKSNIAVYSDQSPTSSGYQNNLSTLRTLGLIQYGQNKTIFLTEAGLNSSNYGSAPASREELHNAWLSKLPNPQARILRALIQEYPRRMQREKVADMSGQSPTSSGYQNNLSALRSLGLIDYPERGYLVALPILFPEGLR